MKNILICGEHLNEGGVETAIVNEAITYKNTQHNVFILAENGIYSSLLKKNGIEIIDMKFNFINGFDLEKSIRIAKFIKEKNIEEIHIHKFINIAACLPACLLTNTPYIIHLHDGIPTSYSWLMQLYPIYEKIFKMYFSHAYKIIAITENVKKFNMELFGIDDDKYIISNNSINFNLYKSENVQTKTIKNFLLISRLSKEKEISIKTGIDIFNEYCKRNQQSKLTIIGGGPQEDDLRKYIRENKYKNIYMMGKTAEVKKEMQKNDIVMGMGRCMIEAIALKKIACMVGYEKPKIIIKNNNINDARKENFSGRGIEDNSISMIVQEIEMLNQEKIKQIVDDNYDYAKKYLDIEKNIYEIKNLHTENNCKVENSEFFEIIAKLQDERDLEKKKCDEIWEGKQWIEQEYLTQKKIIEKLKKD